MTHSKANIFKELQTILHETFEIDPETITLQSRLYDELDLDSIDAVDLIVQLQTLTGRKFQPEEFKSVRTVEDVVTIIDQALHNGDTCEKV